MRQVCEQAEKSGGWVEFMGVELHLAQERWFSSTEDIEKYLGGCYRSKWYKRVCPVSLRPVVITVKTHAAHFQANYDYDATMRFPPFPRIGVNEMHRELVVLHELAHHVTPLKYPGHGAEFAGNFLYMVQQKLGPEYGALLTSAYAAHKVEYRPAKLRKDV